MLALASAGASQGLAGPAPAGPPDRRVPDPALAAMGRRWWAESPDPRNPVACATCHHDPAATRGWAASFPKVRALPPPHRRVMTLLQANAEAVTRHYRLEDPLAAATAITAYLTALGGDVPISPGIDASQPVFPERIRQLTASVGRGETLFAHRCQPCHRPEAVAPRLARFPRLRSGRPEPIEGYLEVHAPAGAAPGLAWNGQGMADVIAFLVSRRVGRPVAGPPDHTGKEAP